MPRSIFAGAFKSIALTIRVACRPAIALAGLLFAVSPAAAMTMPAIFGDHMMLQAGVRLPVWGTAPVGQKVSVRFAGQRRVTFAAADGRWRVELSPLAASRPAGEMVVEADARRVIRDVIVGDVWLASGQSNMEKSLRQAGQKPVFDYEHDIAAADYPQIRLFKVARARRPVPGEDVEGEWVVCSPSELQRVPFSAAAFYFGRKLHLETKRPIGLIDSSYGGTRIEPWTPPEAFARVPSLAEFAAAAQMPGTKVGAIEVGTLWNGMIQPLVPFGLRGIIWYQGESNIIDSDDGAIYADKMTALVEGWRAAWQKQLPFYYVQVAPHLYHVERSDTVASAEAAPRLWEAQAASMRLPHTGMVVTTDLVDDLTDIHPRNKKDVGERLARWALARDYGRRDLVVSGPAYRSLTVTGNVARVRFESAEGLRTRDGKPLSWFTMSDAGDPQRFWPAKAAIEGGTVVVTSDRIKTPAVVRFGWDEAAEPNLVNAAGLPAIPFRSDGPFATAAKP